MSEPIYNPWRESLENCISGDNYLRANEYRELIAELDELYRLRAAPTAPAQAASGGEVVALPTEDKARKAFWGSYPDTGNSDMSEVWMTAFRWCRAMLATPASAPPAGDPPAPAAAREVVEALRRFVVALDGKRAANEAGQPGFEFNDAIWANLEPAREALWGVFDRERDAALAAADAQKP